MATCARRPAHQQQSWDSKSVPAPLPDCSRGSAGVREGGKQRECPLFPCNFMEKSHQVSTLLCTRRPSMLPWDETAAPWRAIATANGRPSPRGPGASPWLFTWPGTHSFQGSEGADRRCPLAQKQDITLNRRTCGERE